MSGFVWWCKHNRGRLFDNACPFQHGHDSQIRAHTCWIIREKLEKIKPQCCSVLATGQWNQWSRILIEAIAGACTMGAGVSLSRTRKLSFSCKNAKIKRDVRSIRSQIMTQVETTVYLTRNKKRHRINNERHLQHEPCDNKHNPLSCSLTLIKSFVSFFTGFRVTLPSYGSSIVCILISLPVLLASWVGNSSLLLCT